MTSVDPGRVAEVLRPRLPSPVERVDDPVATAAGVELWLKRDDLVHPRLPGNKWRKLQHNLSEMDGRTVLTFGGAWSNHLRAVAAAGRLFGFPTVGVVRGEEHLPLNPSLATAVADGMTLTYLDRTRYRDKESPELLATLRRRFGDCLILPEGGSNTAALRGCAELAGEITQQLAPDVVCCPVGTGGTLAGLAAGLPSATRVIGFAALKGRNFLSEAVLRLQCEAYGARRGVWEIDEDSHHGGFARRDAELDDFIVDFDRRHGIALEWVYVAKMLCGVRRWVRHGRFAPGTRVVAVVTGPPFG